jgi:hypothetical protein
MRTITLPSGTYAVDDQLQEFEIIQKESSNVNFVGVDMARRKVYVQFKNGSGYMYSDVDLDTLSFLPAAASIGKFVSSYLVKKFPSEKFEKLLIVKGEYIGDEQPIFLKGEVNDVDGHYKPTYYAHVTDSKIEYIHPNTGGKSDC